MDDEFSKHQLTESIGKIIIVVIVIIIKITIIACWCCRRNARRNRESQIATLSSPVIITSTTHSAPYPNQQGMQQQGYPYAHPAPQPGFAGYPPPAGSTGLTGYPTQQFTPYPTNNTAPTQTFVPVPPHAAPEIMNPPSYDQAVHGEPQQQQPGYQKQSPYNPNF